MRISDWSSDVCSSDLPGNDLLSHARCTLPSARARFTSEFGMGSGGSTQLLSPGRGWRVAQPVDWPINAHTLSLVASEQAHEAACRRRISWDVAKLFASNIDVRSEEHTSELQSLMRISYAVFCLKKKK